MELMKRVRWVAVPHSLCFFGLPNIHMVSSYFVGSLAALLQCLSYIVGYIYRSRKGEKI
jgi:hypothetical protein